MKRSKLYSDIIIRIFSYINLEAIGRLHDSGMNVGWTLIYKYGKTNASWIQIMHLKICFCWLNSSFKIRIWNYFSIHLYRNTITISIIICRKLSFCNTKNTCKINWNSYYIIKHYRFNYSILAINELISNQLIHRMSNVIHFSNLYYQLKYSDLMLKLFSVLYLGWL
jgi:hypothetical protein